MEEQRRPACSEQRYEVMPEDLPLSCPMPDMPVWNAHPRVYLPLTEPGEETRCPYCGAIFVLKAAVT